MLSKTLITASALSALLGLIVTTYSRQELKPRTDVYKLNEPNKLVVIKRNGKFGYSNKSGREVIKAQFNEALNFSEGLASVKICSDEAPRQCLWGFIDETGNYVIKPQFIQAQVFSEGLAAVESCESGSSCKWGYIDRTGKYVIKPQFEGAKSFSEGLALVNGELNWGFINKTGNYVIKPQFDKFTGDFAEGLAPVRVQERWGYIDRTGRLIIKPQFHAAKSFSEGVAAVETCVKTSPDKRNSLECKWGYIDKQQNYVIKPQFAGADRFSEGLAAVTFPDNTQAPAFNIGGYIDKRGNIVIPPQFDSPGPFLGGVALVIDNIFRRAYYIDRAGKKVIEQSDGYIDLALGMTALVKVTLTSKPEGAKVYFIPLRDWEQDPNILNNETKLNLNYRVPDGNTPTSTTVKRKVYIVVFDLQGRKEWVRKDVIGVIGIEDKVEVTLQ